MGFDQIDQIDQIDQLHTSGSMVQLTPAAATMSSVQPPHRRGHGSLYRKAGGVETALQQQRQAQRCQGSGAGADLYDNIAMR